MRIHPLRHLSRPAAAGLLLGASLFSASASADWTQARCDIYPKGSDQASASIPCIFSQRQGHINIDRSDGVSHDLTPLEDEVGHYRDASGKDAWRQGGLGRDGLIFRFADETVYVYWDTAGLPENSREDNFSAPYTTREYDATTRLPCSLQGPATRQGEDCAAGIRRGDKYGETTITIMRPDGVERILQFNDDKVTSPGEGHIEAVLQKDGVWLISIDGRESYLVPEEALVGG